MLGCLNLLGRISDALYESGRRYNVIVGLYLAVVEAPRGTAGNGRGFDCQGAVNCKDCECRRRTDRYMRAYEAVSTHAGRKAHLAINRVVIQDEMVSPSQLEHLICGLNALVRHFGLTSKGKS